MPGFVSVIGAGPGDPELLTVKAVRRLESADLLLYDSLIDTTVIALARQAQRFCVGKRAHQRTVDQSTINRLMILGAQRGKRVVRLKSGDPFVFGRGAEEALALKKANVPFEVIPGITTAVAAAGLAGIPVTHRGIVSGFVVVSGHSEEAFGPIIDDLSPHSMTVVVLMGLAAQSSIAQRLLRCGWSNTTPAAIVIEAGTPQMHTWTGTLNDLRRTPVDPKGSGPGTIVVGDVVGLRSEIETDRAVQYLAEALALEQQGSGAL